MEVPLTSDLEEEEVEEEEQEEEGEGGEREGGGEAECLVSLRLVLSISSQSANWCLGEGGGEGI